MDDGRSNHRTPLWRKTKATWILIAVNVLWYIAVEGTHGLSIRGVIQSGALYAPDVVLGHQWWRVSSAMFVHMSMMHIGLNMVSLASLYVVEWLIGTPMFVLTYCLSGIVGNLATLLLASNQDVSGGASGAIFGIFGVALYMALKGILTKSARNQLLVILVINLVYGFSSANIGNTAHIGGLITGIVLTAVFIKRPQLKFSKSVRFLGFFVAFIVAIGLVLAIPGHSPSLGV